MNPDKKHNDYITSTSNRASWEEFFFESMHKILDDLDDNPSIATKIEEGALTEGDYLNIPENAPECYHVIIGNNGNYRIGSKARNLLPMNVCILDRFEVSYKQIATGIEFTEIYFVFEDDNEDRLAIMKTDELVKANK